MSLVLAAVLAAPAPGLQIDWQAPAACPQAEELRGRVRSLVGAAAERTDLAVVGRVEGAGEAWTLSLELVRAGNREARALRDSGCRGLTEAAAVVIAVAIDPRAGQAGPEDRSGEADAGVVPAPPGGAEDREGPGTGAGIGEGLAPGTGAGGAGGRPRGGVSEGTGAGEGGSGRAERGEVSGGTGVDGVSGGTGADGVSEGIGSGGVSEGTGSEGVSSGTGSGAALGRRGWLAGETGRLALGVRLGGGVGFVGLLPGVHGVIDLGLAVEGRGWRVEGSGVFVPPVRTLASAGIGGVFRVGAGELRGCGVPALRRAAVAFPVCAGLQLGAMHGRGEGAGLTVKTAERSLWAATRIGAAIRWRPRGGRVGLWLGLDAIVALARPAFVTANGATVHETARAGGQAGVGIEVRLR